jgi:hypothetical protein
MLTHAPSGPALTCPIMPIMVMPIMDQHCHAQSGPTWMVHDGHDRARRSSISAGQVLWMLCRMMQMMVFSTRRRRRPFPRGVLEVFVFSQMRTRPFLLGVLELWDLSRRRRRPKLLVALELLVSSRRRRWPMLLIALELLVSSSRRRRPTLLVALELLVSSKRRRWPTLLVALELLVSTRRRRRSSSLLPWSSWSHVFYASCTYDFHPQILPSAIQLKRLLVCDQDVPHS